MKKIDNAIIQKCIDGDEKAFEVIYDTYKDTVYFIAYTFLKDTHIAEDVVQDTFIAVYKNIHTLNHCNAFYAWLHKITYNCCIKKIRKKKLNLCFDNDDITIEDYSDTSTVSNPAIIIHNQHFQEILRQSIDSLSIPLKSVCILRFYEELTISEIAEVLNISNGTVKSRLNRAKQVLSTSLTNQGITPQEYSIDNLQSVIFPTLSVIFKDISIQPTPTTITAIELIKNSKSLFTKQVVSFLGISSIITAMIVVPLVTKEPPIKAIEITNITYDTTFTNQPITLEVNSSFPYDYFTINNKRTTSIINNGEYIIAIYKDNEIKDSKTISINNIDKEAPKQKNVQKTNQSYTIFYHDDISGINPDSIKLYKNNEEMVDFNFDISAQSITFVSEPNNNYVIEISDNAGNLAVTTSSQV